MVRVICLKATPHVNEVYRCSHCYKLWDLSTLHGAWVCPDCGKNISIRITAATHSYECQRVRPEELDVHDIIFLPTFSKESYKILNITKEKNGYNLALEGYGTLCISPDSIVARIMGAWQD